MNRSKMVVAALVAFMALGAIATPSEARSRAYCAAYARDVANHRAGVPQVLGGAVGGAIAGGLLGAVIGGHHSVQTGLIAGGVTGGVLGGAYASDRWHRIYNNAYANCRAY